MCAQSCLTICDPMDCQASPWDFPSNNTGAGCYFLVQGIFLAQGFRLHLLHWQEDS